MFHRLALYTLTFVAVPAVLPAGEVLKPADRLVFVGDSITGQGAPRGNGWIGLIGKALKQADPANAQTLVALGGSGHRVGSWKGIEKRSRTESVILDIKEFDVRAELDRPADVVVVMLGMNDVLSAGLPDTPEGIAAWTEDYRDLIRALRDRTAPRVLAIAPPTPCTEDPRSPKNEVMDRMTAALKTLAAEEDCRLLPTRATAWEVLEAGRRLDPGFHITGDQVHPNAAGHRAIAAGMLRGLGEPEAAEALIAEALPAVDGPALSYEIRLKEAASTAEPTAFLLTVHHGEQPLEFALPDGWSIAPAEDGGDADGDGADGGDGTTFELTATLDRPVNPFTIVSGERSREVRLPAAWLIGTANVGRNGWRGTEFDPAAGARPADAVVRGGGPAELADLAAAPGVPVDWRTFVGGVDYGGAGDPAAIDFAQATYFEGGETGYGLRWIDSDKDRPVTVRISRPGFAGMTHAQVWLNGAEVYSGDPAAAKGGAFDGTLRKGWNRLAFKSNFLQWQWQLKIELEPAEGDDLGDLRYAITPR